jgi:hypothetical protein
VLSGFDVGDEALPGAEGDGQERVSVVMSSTVSDTAG